MTRRPGKIDRWLKLEAVEAAIPAMEAAGAAEVARGAKPSKQTASGFVDAYRLAEGDPETMAELPATSGQSWAERRAGFIARHLAQMRRDTHHTGFRPDGTPTNRLLGLIAWAYVPPESQRRTKAWYKAGCPMPEKRRRNAGKIERYGHDYTLVTFRRNGAEDAPGQVALFTPRALGDVVIQHFASGSNHPGEIRGFAALNKPVGVSVAVLRLRDQKLHPRESREDYKARGGRFAWSVMCKTDCQDALIEAVQAGVPVFLDSGAFSEIDFGSRGPFDVAPITDKDWRGRLAIYERIVDAVGPSKAALVNVVAPDKVADQQETLRRMRRYAPTIRRLHDKGATVLVPLQQGNPEYGGLALPAFHDEAAKALGIRRWSDRWVPALPMKKDATSPANLEHYLRSRRPRRVHLLGVGPTNDNAAAIASAIRRGSPSTIVQGDSVIIRAGVGRASGVKPLTAAQDAARGEALAGRWGSYPEGSRDRRGDALGDYTDEISEPSAWTTLRQRKRIAVEAGLPDEIRDAFLADPDGALQEDYDGISLYMHPAMVIALESAWARRQHMEETAEVKQAAVERVYRDHGPTAFLRNPAQEPMYDRKASLLAAQKLPVPQAADAMVRRMARSGVGTLHRIMLRGEAEQVPMLRRMGYLRVKDSYPPGSTDAPWRIYDVRTTRRLHDAVDATQAARESYRDEFQQVGLFGARRNDGQPGLFGTLPQAPVVVEPEPVVPVGTDLFDHFASLGVPLLGEKGHKPAPSMPAGAWDGLNPHALAASLVDAADASLNHAETRWAWDAAVAGRSMEAEEDGEILFTLPDLLGVPYDDGAGTPMDERDRDALAIAAMQYAMEGSDRVGGVSVPDVIDPGKSRKGPARPRSGRDTEGILPLWASKAILGDRLAAITPGYKNKLRLVNVDKETARRFIEEHHSALPYLNPKGLMFALGAMKGDRLVAVATAGSPTGRWRDNRSPTSAKRKVDQRNVVELTRVASDGSVKGAASKLVGHIIRIMGRTRRGNPNMPILFVTYQLSSEDGTSYKALRDLGLRPVEYRKGSRASGSRAGAAEEDKALSQVDKIRWEYSPTPGYAFPARWSLLDAQPEQQNLLG